MSKKTSELPAAQLGTEADMYMVVQSAESRRQTRSQLRTALVSAWQSFIGTFLSASTAAEARTAIGAQEAIAFGTGVETFLETPSSANLASAVTGETGSGALVFGTAPTLSHPNVIGTTTNDNAPAGSVGELIAASLASGSATALVSGTPKTVTSISLTPGDWDVSGTVGIVPAGTTTTSGQAGGISLTNNTLPVAPGSGAAHFSWHTSPAGLGTVFSVGLTRISVSVTTTVYLVAQSTFAVSTSGAYGFIRARRVR